MAAVPYRLSQTQNKSDPLLLFQFRLEFGGRVTGYFQSVSGLGISYDVVEHKVTANNGDPIVYKTAGRVKYEDVKFSRGVTDSLELWRWSGMVSDGYMVRARRHCSVVMMSRAFRDVARWDFFHAWPMHISGPEPKADSSDIAIEEMTLAHEGMLRRTITSSMAEELARKISDTLHGRVSLLERVDL